MLQPMLEETKQVPAAATTPVDVTTKTTTTPGVDITTKEVSLRRAAVALLIFGMACARPCPSSWGAWLGMTAAVALLVSSPAKLLCRSRFARFLSFFVAIFAGVTVVSLVLSYRNGEPMQISDKVHVQCMDVPSGTFAWAQHKLVEHHTFHRGLSFLSRHMLNADTSIAPTVLVSSQNASSHFVATADPGTWSQPEACDTIAHMVTCIAKMIIIGSTLAHLLLFLSAVAVVKRVCRLRCAAYRAGLLKWKCCKSKCKRAEPAAVATTPAPAAKEMA